jgi:hypothetical protein
MNALSIARPPSIHVEAKGAADFLPSRCGAGEIAQRKAIE